MKKPKKQYRWVVECNRGAGWFESSINSTRPFTEKRAKDVAERLNNPTGTIYRAIKKAADAS